MIRIESISIEQPPFVRLRDEWGGPYKFAPTGELTAEIVIQVSGENADKMISSVYEIQESNGIIDGNKLMNMFGIKDKDDKIKIDTSPDLKRAIDL